MIGMPDGGSLAVCGSKPVGVLVDSEQVTISPLSRGHFVITMVVVVVVVVMLTMM